MRVEDAVLSTVDGARLFADVYHPGGPVHGGVVLVHGFSATRRLDAVVEQARALADAGFVVLAYDSRGHGMSGGECTLGRLEAGDVGIAVDHLRGYVDEVVAVGASMGAIAVLSYAVGDPRLAGIVLVSIPSSLRSVLTVGALAAMVMTRTPPGRAYMRWMTGTRVSREFRQGDQPTAQVARLRVPVAIVHGRQDGMIRARAALELYDAASEPRRVELVERMGHAFQTAGVEPVTRAVEWAFEQRLKCR
ncbi:lysophospholipase [Mycobacterium sp. Y57]|uniref:alpha/beta hydrolase n=1 Tax=Mycolicibacterium xanthum TaxID=2796469 RepID=UPI001C85C67F|nr:alpha/beta fold hydrolase [Mycolicibacterium xanthum]MBX7431863.1 lysophospholipase [Mycolicibacterium xanthum]